MARGFARQAVHRALSEQPEPLGAKRGRGMTVRRPPAPVEAGRTNRTDSPLAANPVSTSTQPISGAGFVKFPGWARWRPWQVASFPGERARAPVDGSRLRRGLRGDREVSHGATRGGPGSIAVRMPPENSLLTPEMPCFQGIFIYKTVCYLGPTPRMRVVATLRPSARRML